MRSVCVAGAVLLLVVLWWIVFFPTFARFAWARGYPWLAYETNYQDANLAVDIGSYYFGSGAYDLPKAAKSYQRAISLMPKIQYAHYQLSRIYFVEGDQARAIQYINDELVINPLNGRSLYVRGLISLAQKDFLHAEADFRNFVAWAPAEWGGYNDLAFTLAKEGKYAESETTIQSAFVHVPHAASVPWLWNSLGLAQLNQLKYASAAHSFTQALMLAKTVTPEQWKRAYSANDPEGTQESINTFQQSIQTNLSTAQSSVTIQG